MMSDSITMIHLSDLHGNFKGFILEKTNIVVVSGDISLDGSRESMLEALDWLASQNTETRLLIPGNHDWYAYEQPEWYARSCKERSIESLVDVSFSVHGLSFYGLPWVASKKEWKWPLESSAWTLDETDPLLSTKVAAIPDSVDVLVCHAPPEGIGDVVSPGTYFGTMGVRHPGNPHVRAYLENKGNPELCLYGHVHDNPGIQKFKTTWCINAAGVKARIILEKRKLIHAELAPI